MEFSQIRSIKADDDSSWRDKIFLTFDIDWAADEVLEDTIDLVEKAGVQATWFVTHDTPLLDRLRQNPDFELGIHPNFNFLFEGDFRNGASANEIIANLMAIIPEATSVRSHSLGNGSYIQTLFVAHGMTHDCNLIVPFQSEVMAPDPFQLWDGLVRVPYIFCDYVHCLFPKKAGVSSIINSNQLRVFDFHPIHVFLNTDSLEQYESCRDKHGFASELIRFRSKDPYGSRSILTDLLENYQ